MKDEASEEVQKFLDLMLYGCSISLDGKRIDPKDVMIERPSEETLSEGQRNER